MNSTFKEFRAKMEAHIKGYRDSLTTIRAGRANPSLVENINFSYYGTETPIKNAATITVPEARLLVIQPWDASALKEIEKAIMGSDLGITPSNDGKVIRLPFPVLTEERRKELVKEVSKRSEQSKVGIRNIRRDLIDEIKRAEKESEINEDEKKTYEKQAQDLTDEFIDKIVEITKAKEAELMEV